MFKLLAILITFSTINPVFANGLCHIKSSSRIILVDSKKLAFSDIAKAENCKPETQIRFLEMISSASGSLRADMIKENFSEKVKITPRVIRINTLNTILGNRYNTFDKWVWTDIKFVSGKSAIRLTQNEKLDFNCDFCKNLGNKSINMVIVDPLKASNRTEWFNASLKVEATALVSNDDIQVTADGLNPASFIEKTILTAKPENFFTNKSKLLFYKLTRPLQKGEPLMFNHITPANLVRQGRAATIILKNSTMSLSGKAMPLSNGKIGEIIQLRNQKSKKVMVGKVIDFNKVVIEL